MPTYEYRCENCGKSFERTETINEHDKAKVKCPKCDSDPNTGSRSCRDIQKELGFVDRFLERFAGRTTASRRGSRRSTLRGGALGLAPDNP